MKRKYQQLSLEQRYTIECLLVKGYKQKEIAELIGVHKSTVSRELQRNINKRGRHSKVYNSERAQVKADERHRSKSKHIRLQAIHLIYIREKLIEERWSPEYISERGKLELGDFVSHETIYSYIWR